MNIDELDPSIGGTERVAYILFNYLEDRYNFNCYYASPVIKKTTEKKFLLHKKTTVDELKTFILENKIDIIINNWPGTYLKLMEGVMKKVECKYIVCYHNSPFYNEKIKKIVWNERRTNIYKDGQVNFKWLLKLLYFPLSYYIGQKKRNTLFIKEYELSDRFVLLCNSYVDEIVLEIGFDDSSKLMSMNNPLSFNNFLSKIDVIKKEKNVLVVARFVPIKRVELALRIWERVENRMSDWSFVIVGYGPEEEQLKSYVAEKNLKRVSFEGKKESEPYFVKASLFLMTSAVEGWPMTLVEAQQKGCVPIAMHSFSALPDIITNGVNGIIIPNNNIDCFVDKLTLLMRDDKLRQQMAVNAIHSSKRFSIDNIGPKWVRLFNELLEK